MRLVKFLILFFICGSLSGQSVSEIYPERGAAFFSVKISGTGLDTVSRVSFNGGEAICYYINPSGTYIQALAPDSVRTGPVTLFYGNDSIRTMDFEVVEGADPTWDFVYRDTLPQTDLPESEWCNTNSWGPPRASSYPDPPEPPEGVDSRLWLQARIIGAALKWRYLPYQHHHIPAFDARECPNFPIDKQVGPGLDCSNYTSWIFLYAYNHNMTSAIRAQAASDDAGSLLNFNESCEPGDLLFNMGSPGGTTVTHVSVFIDPHHRIDESAGFCDIRDWGPGTGWPYNSLHSVRRPLDIVYDKLLDVETHTVSSILLYPNPAESTVKVRGLHPGDKLQVVSMHSISYTPLLEVESEEVYELDISSLAPGYYIIKIQRNNSIISKPFIKSPGIN